MTGPRTALCTGLAALAAAAAGAQAPLPALVEPYPLIHGADPAGLPAVPASPDPLVATSWPATANITGLQRYDVTTPVSWAAFPPSSFHGLESLKSGKPQITVKAAGKLRLDFGREHAAWFELSSPNLPATGVTASISGAPRPAAATPYGESLPQL